MNQVHTQNQGFSVLPQQIQLLKLFHLNALQLQERIQEELMENPLLEETDKEEGPEETNPEATAVEYDGDEEFQNDDIPDYAVEHQNYLSERNMPQRPIPELADFRQELKQQLRTLVSDEHQLMLAEYLVDSLNDSGMLDQGISTMADDISFQKNQLITAEALESARQSLLQLDPEGIGCLSIKEFLIIQLAKQETLHARLAIQLLEKNFGDLAHCNLEKIAAQLQINETDLRIVLKLISSCQLKPMAELSGPQFSERIAIDFVITQQDEVIEVTLFHQRSSTLVINHSMGAMLAKEKSGDKGAQQYVKSKLSSAQWFVSAIQQRETTMLKVMKAIVKFQYDYFRDGDQRLLKPMILKNIADTTGVHISTVSRITCNKYADTPFGVILLKDLFSKGIENEQGEPISNKVIQLAIEEDVFTESKLNPYTDSQLVGLLADKGFKIARRTVAKYREQRQIPVVQMRVLEGLNQ